MKRFKIILIGHVKGIVSKMYKLFYLFLILLIVTCTTTKKTFFIKARNNEEVKIGAFEICGRNFEILSYEEDTALVACIKNK